MNTSHAPRKIKAGIRAFVITINLYEIQCSLSRHLDLISLDILSIGLWIWVLGRNFFGESFTKLLPTVKTMFCNAVFEVDKFDGINYFHMWQCAIMDVLIQQELDITLEDKLVEMSKKDWEKFNRHPCGTIW